MLRERLTAAAAGVPADTTEQFQLFIVLALHSATFTHLQHLSTQSFAQHKALNEYYEQITELTDKVAEAFQGYCGARLPLPYSAQYQELLLQLVPLIGQPEKIIAMVGDSAARLAQAEPALANPLQDIEILCQQTLYLLTLS